MRSLKKNLLGVGVATVLAVAPLSTSHAGLKDAINQMFVSTSTNPQAFSTQRTMGVYGGSMTFRSAGRPISLVQFAAPRIDAGCGGVDIFFGSFSFINGEQFEQLLRAIMSQAVGFAIKAAINKMCNPCGAILNQLEELIRDFNQRLRNTCAIAASIAAGENPLAGLGEKAAELGETIKVALSKSSDSASAQNERITQTNAQAAAETKDENPITGNLVWRAAQDTYGRGGNTLSFFLTNDDAIAVVMGLLGTTIIPTESTGVSGSCSGAASERCGPQPEMHEPRFNAMRELLHPKQHYEHGRGVAVYRCLNSDCTRIGQAEIPLSTWGGVEEEINLAMFGVRDPESVSWDAFTPDSIVGSILHSNSTLSAKARQLIEISPVPIYRLLLELQHSPGSVVILGEATARLLYKPLAYRLGMDVMRVARSTFSGVTTVYKPSHFEDHLQLLQSEMVGMAPDGKEYAEAVETIFQISRHLSAIMPRMETGSRGGAR